jgi:prevent-host-death family protein
MASPQLDQPCWSDYILSMTRTLNIAEAKAHLSEIVTSAAAGEDIIIARAGKPMVRLVQVIEAPKQKRAPGFLKGWLSDEQLAHLDDPLPPDEQAALEGEHTDAYGVLLPQFGLKHP